MAERKSNYIKDYELELIVHNHGPNGGKFYKLMNISSSIIWSGDIKSPSRTLEVNLIQAVNDEKIQSLGIKINSTLCFYVDKKELFRGQIVDIDKASNSNSIKLTAKDIGFFLTKDEVNFNFKNTTACDIAKAVFKGKDGAISLPWGKIAPAGTKITQMFIGTTRYDTIMSAYTEHSKADKEHKKYMIEVNIDKFNVIEKGITTLKLEFDEAKNLEYTNYKESIDKLVNRVLVVDESGNKIKEHVNKELKNLYKFYITKVIDQKKDKVITDADVKGEFHGSEKTCSLKGFGDISCKSGYKVQVKDNFTGLVGEFYIDSDKHTWSGGKYSIDLGLNFDNIMDEKSVGKDESKKTGGLVGDVSQPWKGITLEMIQKELANTRLKGYAAFVLKCAHAYGVNPIIMINIWKVESYPEIRSGLAVKHNNFGGMTWAPSNKYGKVYMGDRFYVKCPTIEAGIEENFRLVGVTYIHKRGLKSLNKIMGIYSPSYENDTSGYLKTLKSKYKKLTGKTWDDKYIGTGVPSEQEAKNKMIKMEQQATQISGSTASGNAIVRKAESYLAAYNAGRFSHPTRYAWCCWFTNKCIKDSGGNPPPASNTNLCDSYYNAYKNAGRLRNPSSYIPKPGDCIFFYGSGGYARANTNHIGIVTGVTGSGSGIKIHTIEGNSGNAVRKRTYGRNGASWAKIVGYGIN